MAMVRAAVFRSSGPPRPQCRIGIDRQQARPPSGGFTAWMPGLDHAGERPSPGRNSWTAGPAAA